MNNLNVLRETQDFSREGNKPSISMLSLHPRNPESVSINVLGEHASPLRTYAFLNILMFLAFFGILREPSELSFTSDIRVRPELLPFRR